MNFIILILKSLLYNGHTGIFLVTTTFTGIIRLGFYDPFISCPSVKFFTSSFGSSLQNENGWIKIYFNFAPAHLGIHKTYTWSLVYVKQDKMRLLQFYTAKSERAFKSLKTFCICMTSIKWVALIYGLSTTYVCCVENEVKIIYLVYLMRSIDGKLAATFREAVTKLSLLVGDIKLFGWSFWKLLFCSFQLLNKTLLLHWWPEDLTQRSCTYYYYLNKKIAI